MKTQAEQTEAPAETATVAPAPVTVPLTRYGQVLALQRTAGNRAVAQMIAQGAAIARDTTTVEEYVREESNSTDDTTWTAKFDVTFDEDASPPTCWLKIKTKLNPGGGVSEDDVKMTKMRVRSRFSLLWDSKFVLHEHRTIRSDRDWLLRPGIEFVDSGQHLTVNLHAGRGNDDRQNWYMGSPEYVYAARDEPPDGPARRVRQRFGAPSEGPRPTTRSWATTSMRAWPRPRRSRATATGSPS